MNLNPLSDLHPLPKNTVYGPENCPMASYTYINWLTIAYELILMHITLMILITFVLQIQCCMRTPCSPLNDIYCMASKKFL